ncbi:MAG: aldehyde ferredoxin oxidoreductase N-terminal domain-containing protein [Dehalococcoidia bacterium]
MATFGYAGKILRVDLSSGSRADLSTMDYADRFLGGRGIAAKIYWDQVSPEVSAFDEGNSLIFATGPLAGVSTVGGSRWQVCGKSAASTPEQFSYCNLGGHWGAQLKFAGYDAIVVQGKSEKPVYLFLDGETVELKDASALWGRSAIETREILKSELGSSARVVAIGPAGENMAIMATLLADNDSSGSGGLGAVMGSKKLKAIVVRGAGKGVKVAHPERLRELVGYYRELKRMPLTVTMTGGRDLRARMKKDVCYGCLGCGRRTYEAEDGQKGKFMCGSSLLYQSRALKYYGEWTDVPFYANKLCDSYGLDTQAIDLMISWLQACYKAGILTDENTGIPLSQVGSLEFIETLLRKVSLREGIGDVLAQGIVKAADSIGSGAREQLGNTGHFSKADYKEGYGPRLYITHALLYALEPRTPIQQLHEVGLTVSKWANWASRTAEANAFSDAVRAIARKFWGSEVAADFSTCEGKALAAKMIQDRQYAKECLILCDFLWPIIDLDYSQGDVGDPSLESKILSAVTGSEVDEQGLYAIGERVFNLQRAILVRDGRWGRDYDSLPDHCFTAPLEYDFVNRECLVPGKDGEIISRKGSVVDRAEFERMKDEYYQLRQWDVATGLQTRAKLEQLGLRDVAQDLEHRELIA